MRQQKISTELTVEKPDEIRLALYEKAKLNPAAFPEFLARFNGRMKFIKGEKPAFCYRRQKNSRGEEADPLKLAESILDKMQDLLEERT